MSIVVPGTGLTRLNSTGRLSHPRTIDVLRADPGYTDWLMAQSWVRERYAAFHTLIINNFGEPSETPEHNALQALFLDDDFCRGFVNATTPGGIDGQWQRIETANARKIADCLSAVDDARKELAAIQDTAGWRLRDRRWFEERKRLQPPADDARQRYTMAQAELKELQLAEKRGDMISVDDIAPIITEELSNLRQRLMEMPGRLAPNLVGMMDAGKIEMAIRAEIDAALAELTSDRA
jgi:hypothetical protein